MASTPREGRVVTFYSYKGGVGRTMALANVAFLAAMNRRRVLVMDWDLEAPGLHYYFRGLLDAPEARALKESPGILNFVWDWTESLKDAVTGADTNAVFERFDDPAIYETYVRSVMDNGDGGVLDFINAGSPRLGLMGAVDYADALAQFSWSTFFSDYAGGRLLEGMRQWARSRYDYILIDSRTGLADVSGICTTQLPDVVALCFILNRQNIDGVSKVAASIRHRRRDELRLHAVPMRMAGSGTGGEEDARARGIHELSRVGGFSAEAVTEDFRRLWIRLADSVPYYETLAAFAATDLETDPLTLNYLRLANHLLDTTLEMPELSRDWVAMVNRRLQPRHATIDYVSKLISQDPIRAIIELETLLESAFETALDGGGLNDDYVNALIEASLFLASRSDSPIGALDMLHRTLDLLRALAEADPAKWRSGLASAIERQMETMSFYLEAEEELALLEELDGLLADAATVADRLRRLARRRRAARLYLSLNDLDAAVQTVGECLRMIKDIRTKSPRLAGDQTEQLAISELEAQLIRGEISERQSNWTRALAEFEAGLDSVERLADRESLEAARLAFDFHSRLARAPADLVDPERSADHAVSAARLGAEHFPGVLVTQFNDLARIVLAGGDPRAAIVFSEHALDSRERRMMSQNANFWGRTPRSVLLFFHTILDLVRRIGEADHGLSGTTLDLIAETCGAVYRIFDRRRHVMNTRSFEELSKPLAELEEAFLQAGSSTAYAVFRDAVRRRSPPSSIET